MWLGKRFFDFIASGIGLFFLFPIFVIIAIWIKKDSKGPIFFRQARVGKGEKLFWIHKFRTMAIDAEKKGLKITIGKDPRITKSGHFIRKYKIDELPQLIDVFIGKMSLVGPRPEVPVYVSRYSDEEKRKIFQMRPGITDWASIKFKDENSLLEKSSNPEATYVNEILPIKISYYLKYYESSSFREDLKIIFATINEIFNKRR